MPRAKGIPRSKAVVGWDVWGAAFLAGAIPLVYWAQGLGSRADTAGETLVLILLALLLILGFLGLVLLGLGLLGVGTLVDWYQRTTD